MDGCFQSLGLTNDLSQPVSQLQLLAQNFQHAGAAHLLVHAVLQSAGRGNKNDRRPALSGPLEVFENDPLNAGRAVRSSEWGSDTLSTHTRAFWLGATAFASPFGSWRYDDSGGGGGGGGVGGASTGSSSLLHAAVQTTRLKYHPLELNTACQHRPPIPTPQDAVPPDNHISPTHQLLHPHHSSSSLLVIAGFSQSAADILTAALSTHPLFLAPLDGDQELHANDATASVGLAAGAYCARHFGTPTTPTSTTPTTTNNTSTTGTAANEGTYRARLTGTASASRRHQPPQSDLALASSPCLMNGVCVRTHSRAVTQPQEQRGLSVEQSSSSSSTSSSSSSSSTSSSITTTTIADIYERRCLAHVESSENFTRIETNVLYASMDPARVAASLPIDAKACPSTTTT